MVQISPAASEAMRSGLHATSFAIGMYAAACRDMSRMPEAKAIAANLDLSVRRLEAMRRDLERRSSAHGQDALFIGLNVAQAGLSSLTDAIGEMRESYYALQPTRHPPQGWFEPESGPRVEAAQLTS